MLCKMPIWPMLSIIAGVFCVVLFCFTSKGEATAHFVCSCELPPCYFTPPCYISVYTKQYDKNFIGIMSQQ